MMILSPSRFPAEQDIILTSKTFFLPTTFSLGNSEMARTWLSSGHTSITYISPKPSSNRDSVTQLAGICARKIIIVMIRVLSLDCSRCSRVSRLVQSGAPATCSLPFLLALSFPVLQTESSSLQYLPIDFSRLAAKAVFSQDDLLQLVIVP
ncbi:hypothetical protein L218DRAFT_1079796 [Marasmius fiardii PR-910]|nr:hypothetical protein L218DRAFT_1079796 [Marasmius fiardii PR-910]